MAFVAGMNSELAKKKVSAATPNPAPLFGLAANSKIGMGLTKNLGKTKTVQVKKKNPMNLADLLKPRDNPLLHSYQSTQDGVKKLKVIKIKKGPTNPLNNSISITSPIPTNVGGNDAKSIPKISLRKIKLNASDKQSSPRGLGGNEGQSPRMFSKNIKVVKKVSPQRTS